MCAVAFSCVLSTHHHLPYSQLCSLMWDDIASCLLTTSFLLLPLPAKRKAFHGTEQANMTAIPPPPAPPAKQRAIYGSMPLLNMEVLGPQGGTVDSVTPSLQTGQTARAENRTILLSSRTSEHAFGGWWCSGMPSCLSVKPKPVPAMPMPRLFMQLSVFPMPLPSLSY